MDRSQLRQSLAGGLFISSMMGVTDGSWVADRARGARMVQIGALIADTEDRSHEARYLLPLREDAMVEVLKREVDQVRKRWRELPIGLNAAPGDLESALCMARAFERAGGDFFELNCHGGYARLLARGRLQAMVLPENRREMHSWLRGLCELSIPVVVKFNGTMENVDFPEVLAGIADIPRLFGVHFNIRSRESKSPNLSLVKQVRPLVAGMLFCSGHVSTPSHVAELLAARVDGVGIAQGLLDEPGILERLSSQPQDAS